MTWLKNTFEISLVAYLLLMGSLLAVMIFSLQDPIAIQSWTSGTFMFTVGVGLLCLGSGFTWITLASIQRIVSFLKEFLPMNVWSIGLVTAVICAVLGFLVPLEL